MDSFPFHFCPKCGGKLKIVNKEHTCSVCDFVFYQNSKPCVGILILDQDRVLLTRRGIQPHLGEYDIVGGFLNNGELPEDGIYREVDEELKVKIKIIDLLGFYINDYGSKHIKTLDIFYIGKIVSGIPTPHDDVASLEWHSISKLPTSRMISVAQALHDLPKWYSQNSKSLSVSP